ncbi:MAG: response regulator, partial [Acetobacteraceae bacterium]
LLDSAAPPRLDAVVSDVVMPGIDGLALVGALRASRPALPAILVSGYADEALRREMSEHDMLFLAKPYAMKALVAAVQSLAGPQADTAASTFSEPRVRFAQQQQQQKQPG